MSGERGAVVWSRAIAFAPLVAALFFALLSVGFARLVDFGTLEPVPAPQRTELETLLPGLAPATRVADAEPAPQPAPARLDAHVAELHARIAWTLSALALLTMLAIAVAFAGVLAHRALEPPHRHRRMLMGAAALLLLALGVGVWQGEAVVLPHLLQVLVNELLPAVTHVREASKGLTVVGVGSLLLALSALLLPDKREAAAVAEKVRALRTWLYVAAGLLVAGVLEIAFLVHWPVARLEPPDGAAVAKLAEMVTTAAGTILTLLLALTYGIGAWILSARANTLAGGLPPKERTEWLARNGFDSTVGEQLARVVAMLAPLVAGGPLTALLQSLA